jgi:hypothetical protein
MTEIDDIFGGHLANFPVDRVSAVRDFERFGMIRVNHLIPPEWREGVRAEVLSLLDGHAERRDLFLATTGYTPRAMYVVQSELIAANGVLIPGIYRSPVFLQTLADIAGQDLYPCPQADEEFLITRLERKGDTHGWHWGDFSFALIWIIQAPPIAAGGLLQCVPHTTWDKQNPRIFEHLTENPINSYHFQSGEAYLMRTDTTLHRVMPLVQDTTRIILNMTWASAGDLARPIRGDDRWWTETEAKAAATSVPGGTPQ